MYHEPNEIVKIFLRDALKIAGVSALRINMGTKTVLNFLLITLPMVVFIIPCRSAVLKVLWKSKLLVIFLRALQKPNIGSTNNCPFSRLLAIILWLLISNCFNEVISTFFH